MKKNKIKDFLFTGSIILLMFIVIFAVRYFIHSPDDEFAPFALSEPPVSTPGPTPTPASDISIWDNDLKTKENTTVSVEVEPPNSMIGKPDDNTQVISSENETETVSSLTEPEAPAVSHEKPSNKPTEKPKPITPDNDPKAPPAYDKSVPQTTTPTPTEMPDKTPTKTPKKEETSKSNESQAGKVYDPVFGWIEVGPTNQDVIDSDGDIDKQIGSMGDN